MPDSIVLRRFGGGKESTLSNEAGLRSVGVLEVTSDLAALC